MGSYAECWLGELYVGSTKNGVDPGLMQFFRASDKRLTRRSNDTPPFQIRRWVEHVEEGEDLSVLFYTAPAAVVRDRLELLGYTVDTAMAALEISLRADEAMRQEWASGQHGELFQRQAEILRQLNADIWMTELRRIRTERLKQRAVGGDTSHFEGTVLGYMLDQDWYGYSGPDLNVGLRLAIEVCPDADELVYDLTDLVLSGYVSEEDDLVASSAQFYGADQDGPSGKVVVLTEGRSDSRMLAESIELLYPHLADYFTFMDFDGARVAGGAGSLVNIVKAFVGAGIINRVIALFDNDTAAESALRALRSVRLPDHILVRRLPKLDTLRDYPTVGPGGLTTMDVNGIAASIELYLGQDVLADEFGALTPVQWTGYDSSVQKYQGELLSKDVVQDRFWRRMAMCRSDRTVVDRTDWSGMRAILSELFTAFREVDHALILENIDQYHAR